MVLAISLTTSPKHTPNTVIRGVMPWKNQLLYFAVMATLTSFKLCVGHADDAEAVAQRPVLQGSLRFRSGVSGVNHESAAPTRHGSLAFKYEGDLNSTHVLHSVMDAKLKRMDPSVQCSDNQMTLKVRRDRSQHFLVDSGKEPLTPLSEMPSKCGFSVKRSRRDVQFSASYDGCHVTQQGKDYILPLRLWGTPMTMSCPAVIPLPSVSCSPSVMVLKISGVPADEVKLKVSDTWKSLSSVCSSCGIDLKVFPGGMTITVPYNRDSCVQIKDEEYLVSLLLADIELLVACPSEPHTEPTTTTTTTIMPPGDSREVLQHPQYPQILMFPQYPLPMPTPAPNTGNVGLLLRPQLPIGATARSNPENQEAPVAQHPAFPFMSRFPQYFLFPRPDSSAQSSGTRNIAAPPAQMPQSPQHQFLYSPQFYPTPSPPPPPPAKDTGALVTTPTHAIKQKGKPQVPQQSQFPLPPQYPFLLFTKRPLSPRDQIQAVEDPKPILPQPKPHRMYPQIHQFPLLYPPPKYPSQRHNTEIVAPATPPTSGGATTQKPAAQKPLYHPHPYMPVYYIPQQAAMPVFPDPPTTPPTNTAPSDQHEHQPDYRAMPPHYPLRSHQRRKSLARNW